ncbi:MAG TPA: hypothetical protein VGR43_08425, partial [Dehalococcoidia bacterium]|nr:hypothetical protein [Dehalococcoidia bacterium]
CRRPRKDILIRSRLRRPAGLYFSVPLLLLILCAGCSGDTPETTPSPAASTPATASGDPNLLANGGFELGADPWITLAPEAGFEVTPEQAHSGGSSARLRMRDPADASGAKVYYLVQEINPDDFPDVVHGYYRVENWNKGTIRQYLQFVIIAIGPKNFQSQPDPHPNYQIRYPLAGINSPPFAISNAKFEFLGRAEPVLSEWIPFQANVRADFQRLWNQVPDGYERLRLLFEVRWDGKVAGDGTPAADVYYDDLYAGPEG